MLYCIIFLVKMLLNYSSPNDSINFQAAQLKNSRVQVAYSEKESKVKKLFADKNLEYPPKEIYFRAFKTEKIFEVWSYDLPTKKFVLVRTYPICQSSGVIGPKRQEGDLQVPEGFYHISVFNPNSNYFLSLGINYPNASDSVLTTNKKAPGGDIYIHGDCLSIGCIPLTDDFIKEVYLMAVKAKDRGQSEIPVHIFPFKFNNQVYESFLLNYKNNLIKDFWNSLKSVYTSFEKYKLIPKISITKEGKYIMN